MKRLITVIEPQTERNGPATHPGEGPIEWELASEQEGGEPLALEPLELPREEESPSPFDLRAENEAAYLESRGSREVMTARPPVRVRNVTAFRKEEPPVLFIDTGYWLWVARGTWAVIQYFAPVALILGGFYGLYVLLAWLVQQTIFWMAVGLVAVAAVLLSAIQSRPRWEDRGRTAPDRKPGQVITNVRVEGGTLGDVVTNIFVTSKPDKDENF